MDLKKTDNDIILKRKNRNLWLALSMGLFIVIVFFSAFIAGFLKIIFGHHKIQLKNIYSGIVLGKPNYLSIYFVLEALNQLGGITVLNIGVVLISALISFIYYKEKINFINWIGISLVCISIFLILYKYDV